MQQIIMDFGFLRLFGGEIALRVYGYGLMLVLGFLCGIYLAQWRARRTGENPDAVMACGILSLIGGVIGARAAFVIEKWQDFAKAPNTMAAVLDVSSGGLIFFGGIAGAIVLVVAYLLIKRLSIRRYLDLIAVSLMIGLAFGRAGCLLNGCCFGGPAESSWALSTQFPMYSQPLVKTDGSPGPFSSGTEATSPVFAHQLKNHLFPPGYVDDRLMCIGVQGAHPHSPRFLHGPLSGDQLAVMFGGTEDARRLFEQMADDDGMVNYDRWNRALAAGGGFLRGSEMWDDAMRFRCAECSASGGQIDFDDAWAYLQARKHMLLQKFGTSPDGALTAEQYQKANAYLQEDLYSLAAKTKSLPVKPSQAIAIVNALLLAGLLMMYYRLRRRDGKVFALLLVLYPITRFILEAIRDDNKHNLANLVLTHNQVTSAVVVVVGIVMWLGLRRLPASAGPIWSQRQA